MGAIGGLMLEDVRKLLLYVFLSSCSCRPLGTHIHDTKCLMPMGIDMP